MLQVKDIPRLRELQRHADALDTSLRVTVALLADRDHMMGCGTETSARVIAEAKALIAKGLPRP
jgi:hypothetical protein